jgi:hypothetical protein
MIGAEYLSLISYIVVIASAVQLVEMFVRKTSPALFQALGIYLPLITTNCAILAVALFQTQRGYGLVQGLVFALGAGLGFTLALVLMAGIRERLAGRRAGPRPGDGHHAGAGRHPVAGLHGLRRHRGRAMSQLWIAPGAAGFAEPGLVRRAARLAGLHGAGRRQRCAGAAGPLRRGLRLQRGVSARQGPARRVVERGDCVMKIEDLDLGQRWPARLVENTRSPRPERATRCASWCSRCRRPTSTVPGRPECGGAGGRAARLRPAAAHVRLYTVAKTPAEAGSRAGSACACAAAATSTPTAASASRASPRTTCATCRWAASCCCGPVGLPFVIPRTRARRC